MDNITIRNISLLAIATDKEGYDQLLSTLHKDHHVQYSEHTILRAKKKHKFTFCADRFLVMITG
jgi:hypothetical protein